MAPIFGAIFFARIPASLAAGATALRSVVCDEMLTPGVLNELAAAALAVPQCLPGFGALRQLAAPHNHTCGKFDLAHWNIIYQNFDNAAPGDPSVSSKKRAFGGNDDR